jgi:hypothetical protein
MKFCNVWREMADFNKGEVVVFKEPHPLAEQRGVVEALYSSDCFGVRVANREIVTAKAKDLELFKGSESEVEQAARFAREVWDWIWNNHLSGKLGVPFNELPLDKCSVVVEYLEAQIKGEDC